MPIINYVREHMRFIDYARDEHLSGNERLLWYALMHIMNQHAQGRVWPGDFIRISNDHLLSYCPMKFDTLASVRNRLKQRGLIDFRPGSRNREHPSYKLFYFFPNDFYGEAEFGEGYTENSDKNIRGYAENSDKTGVYTENSDKNSPKEPFYPKNSDIMGYNMGDNMGYNMGDKTGDKGGNIYINKTNKQYPNREFEEDKDKRARVREEIQSSWLKSFGTNPTPALVRAIEDRAMNCDFEDGVLAYAIETAAVKGMYSPADYLISMLCEWGRLGIRTWFEANEQVYKPVHNIDDNLPF